jgi:hypothetical protein
MPIFLASLLGGLVSAAGSIGGRVLLAMGFGYVAFTGISTGLDALKASVQSYLSGAPADVVGIMSTLKVDVSVSIIFSAIAARLLLNGLVSGTIKRMVLK